MSEKETKRTRKITFETEPEEASTGSATGELLTEPPLGALEQAEPATPTVQRKNIFLEAWDGVRDKVRALIEHFYLFIILPVMLILYHYFLEVIHLPPEYEKIAKFFEFVGAVATFAIFTIGFIMELIVLLWRKKDGNSH